MEEEHAVFADQQRRRLVQRLLAPWRRRGATLLQVGLGAGLLPDFFWEAGFDVTGLDAAPGAVEAARQLTGPRVDYALGKPDHLPFDDGRFDYVVLAHLRLTPRTALPLDEALRVASLGVIALEWNFLSVPALSRGPWRRGVWPWTLTWMARKACPDARLSLYSTLPWPLFLWPRVCPPRIGAGGKTRAGRVGHWLRGLVIPVPFGAIMGLRLEKNPALMTPIGAVTAVPQPASYARQPVVNRVRGDISAPGC
ncbi:MAG: class I SAM-dependent methyltransferase [Desulfovibrionaceae bacterium]|nr:class I SAM-dependent methyltransferase [Desulfovibrionaceae bacterium]